VREAVGRWVGELIGEMCGLLGFGWLGEFGKSSVLGIGAPNIELGFGNWNMRRNVVFAKWNIEK
jgi:hypothetical protein